MSKRTSKITILDERINAARIHMVRLFCKLMLKQNMMTEEECKRMIEDVNNELKGGAG